MSSRADQLRAELALAETEEAFSEAKAARNTPDIVKLRDKVRKARAELRGALADTDAEYAAHKQQVREARAASRQAREG